MFYLLFLLVLDLIAEARSWAVLDLRQLQTPGCIQSQAIVVASPFFLTTRVELNKKSSARVEYRVLRV